MRNKTAGFSFVELLVVVAMVAILASVVYSNLNNSTAQARDAERQSDLRSLQNAVELYKQKHGNYPEGCNGGWSSQKGGDNECGDGTGEYIRGLAPEFISVLPKDPKLNGTKSGYAYLTNADGTSYKIVANKTVEEFPVYKGNNITNILSNLTDFRYCHTLVGADRICETSFSACQISGANGRLKDSYAMVGGYATDNDGIYSESRTQQVWCSQP